MAERRGWSEEEDRILTLLIEERGITKWAEIARVMEREFALSGRSGKQCRERYHNHLDHTIKHGKWLKQQQNSLIAKHNAMGNRWADISRAITGRSQNCVKNKFYSILRKGLRYINSAIRMQLKKYKQIEIGVIYKLVEACELNYKHRNLTKQMVGNMDIKKQIIYYGMRQQKFPNNEEEYVKIKDLIDQIKLFAKVQKKQSNRTIRSRKVDQQPQHQHPVFQKQVMRNSLQNLLMQAGDGVQQKATNKLLRRSSRRSISPLLSKHISNFSNYSKKSKELEQRPYNILPINSTIKSFQLPQFEQKGPLQPIVMLESSQFDPIKCSYNSLSHLYHN